MANNRIYLTCSVCGAQICIGKSFCEGAYYANYSDTPLEDRLNDFYEKHTHLESAETCNLLGTNFYIEHEYFDDERNKLIRDLYPNEKETEISEATPEYLRFLDMCAMRANEIWLENEMKILAGMNKAMDFVQVVRCHDCMHYESEMKECHKHDINSEYVFDNDFCAWGERNEG